MTPFWQDDWLTVYQGDCRAVMAEMPAESVHCVVTSPPYWGLRDYGQVGQLGLEPTPEEYVANMVAVFREVRRVLRADGTVWLNLGDSYANDMKWGGSTGGKHAKGLHRAAYDDRAGFSVGMAGGELNSPPAAQHGLGREKQHTGLKPKDLVGIPWRVAFALQADGWYLRSDIIWSKPNPMPESVTDRPTKSHEYLFLMSKSPRYYYDADAVREPNVEPTGNGGWQNAVRNGDPDRYQGRYVSTKTEGASGGSKVVKGERVTASGRNLRSVWNIATQPYPGAHFATFPRKLVEPCIKAGTSERGVCPECGAPWVRVVERGESHYAQIKGDRKWQEMEAVSHARGEIQNVQTRTDRGTVPSLRAATSATTGWQPGCRCHLLPNVREDAVRRVAASELSTRLTPTPATVLDPFAGSGTTALVAQSLGRRAILIDLSTDYLAQIMRRNAQMPLPA